MEAAFYARVSTQRQAQAQSIDGQLERLFAHAAAQDWHVVPETVFRDDGYSGSSLRRPGLDRLRDLVQTGRVDRVLVTAPDRRARNYVHQVLLVEELQQHGAQVDFLDRPMSHDPHDQLLLQIRGAVAEYERTLIAERTRRGRLRKLKAGLLLPWTKPPYGYRLDPDQPRDPAGVRIDEAEAAVVRDIYTWYTEEGLSLTGLVKRLRRHGITSPAGRPLWSTAALHLVLTNPVYTGRVFANRYRVAPAQKRRSALAPVGRGRDGNKRATSPDEWIEVGLVPAIITQAQHDRAAEQLRYNARMAKRSSTRPYLLRGLVSCGRCRHGCIARHLPSGYDYYLCRTRAQPRSLVPGEGCDARYVPATQLEELVWRDLCDVVLHPDAIARAIARARGGHWLPQEMQSRRVGIRRGRAALGQQIERLTEAYLAGVVALAEYERRRHDMEARLAALESHEQALIVDAAQRDHLAKLAAHVDDFCARVRAGLETASFERKRELLQLLVDRVIVTGDEVEIRYAVPIGPDGERQPFCRLRQDHLPLVLPLGARRPGARSLGLQQNRSEADVNAEALAFAECTGRLSRSGPKADAPVGPPAVRWSAA